MTIAAPPTVRFVVSATLATDDPRELPTFIFQHLEATI